MVAPASAHKWSDLAVRVMSGIILVVFAGLADFAGGWIFKFIVILAGCQIFREWLRMTQSKGQNIPLILAGVMYAAAPAAALIYLRDQENGASLIAFLVALVVATDVGAYFAGRSIGGPKLLPRYSPNKTWAGLLGGMACSSIIFSVGAHYLKLPFSGIVWGVLMGSATAVLAQIGDLFESGLKRHYGFKDSGKIIPGHGGLMDRIDGLIPVVVIAALFIWASS